MDWKAPDFIHPDTAGIDVGRSEHVVAVSPDCDLEPSAAFRVFYRNLRPMGRWLINRGVRSVALQSTGVHWMAVLSLDDDAIETVVYPTQQAAEQLAEGSIRLVLLTTRLSDRRPVEIQHRAGRAKKTCAPCAPTVNAHHSMVPAFKTSSIGYLYLYVI